MKTPGDTMAHHWGQSTLLAIAEHYAVVRLESIGYGGASSRHYHQQWDQALTVTRGSVRVILHEAPQAHALTILRPGQTLRVAAGQVHRLDFTVDSEAIEVYSRALDADRTPFADIVRVADGYAHITLMHQ